MSKMTAYLLSLMALSVVLSTACFATDYTVSAPDSGPLVKETSVSLPYVEANVDKSKTAAIIPPTFGSATSYVPVIETYLTPNLVDSTVVNPTYTDIYVDDGYFDDYTDYDDWWWYDNNYGYSSYDIGDTIGYLYIPELGIYTTVYEGTTDENLANGVGHFVGTGITDGNIVIAGHNRGDSTVFGEIYTLDDGDKIYFTVDGDRTTFEVVSVEKISVSDTYVLNDTSDDQITLITCVANQPNYRWCIIAET